MDVDCALSGPFHLEYVVTTVLFAVLPVSGSQKENRHLTSRWMREREAPELNQSLPRSQNAFNFQPRMKILAAIIFTGLLAGCATMTRDRDETFVAVTSPIDQSIDTATIEDYILALPPFEFHEETVEQFTEKVKNARMTEKQNLGKDRDFLFVKGDGSAPSKIFILDRRRQMLTIRRMNWEPGMTEDTITMRRIPGGWMRGHRIELKTAQQAVTAVRT